MPILKFEIASIVCIFVHHVVYYTAVFYKKQFFVCGLFFQKCFIFFMAIIWYDTIKRLTVSMGPLTRAGYLENKMTSVDRVFDHLSFSYREGAPDMKLLVHFRGRETIVTKPHCMLYLPGEHAVTTPLVPCNEFYFVIQHPEQFLGEQKPAREDAGLFFPEEGSLFFTYMKMFLQLFNGPVSPGICTQLDCLALAMLGSTYYGRSRPDRETPVEAIEGYINNHYTEEIDFEEVAAHYGLSFSTFRRQWKQYKEETPGQMVLRLRNRTALELLRNRQLQIGEVAEMTGYPDIRYFSRFFRRMNNMTPTEYREMIFRNDL